MPHIRAYGGPEIDVIFGGFDGTDSFNSAEAISEEGIWEQALLDLPVKVHQHCVVYLLLYDFIVIGGIQDGQPSKKTYIYSILQGGWSEGPELSVARSGASCGYINGYEHVVVAGGYNNDGHLSSTEVELLCILSISADLIILFKYLLYQPKCTCCKKANLILRTQKWLSL